MANESRAIVISGDIIGSSSLQPAARKKLQGLLDMFFEQVVMQWPDMQAQQYRGDSVQAILTYNRIAALRVALLFHSFLIKENFKIRLAIGVGNISYKGAGVITSDGSAFQASGPYLDELAKTGEVISIAGEDDDFTSEWQAHSGSLNYII